MRVREYNTYIIHYGTIIPTYLYTKGGPHFTYLRISTHLTPFQSVLINNTSLRKIKNSSEGYNAKHSESSYIHPNLNFNHCTAYVIRFQVFSNLGRFLSLHYSLALTCGEWAKKYQTLVKLQPPSNTYDTTLGMTITYLNNVFDLVSVCTRCCRCNSMNYRCSHTDHIDRHFCSSHLCIRFHLHKRSWLCS